MAPPQDISDDVSPEVPSSKSPRASNEKSWKQQKKDAVLRKAGGAARVPAPHVEAAPPPPKPSLPTGEKKEESWSQKRAQHFLATHGGPRTPRASKEDLGSTDTSATSSGSPRSPRSPRGAGELSWTEQRKEAYRRKYGIVRPEAVAATDVTVSAVKFFVKLKTKAAAASSAEAAGDGSAKGSSDVTAAEEPKRPSSARKPGELTWTQKRKEAYLRKYGHARLGATTDADVAVTALSFTSKLKLRAKKAK